MGSVAPAAAANSPYRVGSALRQTTESTRIRGTFGLSKWTSLPLEAAEVPSSRSTHTFGKFVPRLFQQRITIRAFGDVNEIEHRFTLFIRPTSPHVSCCCTCGALHSTFLYPFLYCWHKQENTRDYQEDCKDQRSGWLWASPSKCGALRVLTLSLYH